MIVLNEIVFLRGFYPNPRCERRIDTLSKDFDLYLIYWEKGKNKNIIFERDNVKTKRICIEANPTEPTKRLYQYIKLYKEVYKLLKSKSIEFIYPEALDMLVIAYIYKIFHRNVKIIYEVADIHELIIDKPKNLVFLFLQVLLKLLEKICCKRVDLMVVTSKKYYDAYYKSLIDFQKVLYIPNSPNPKFFEAYKPKNHRSNLTVGFIGSIRYKKEIEMLLNVADRRNWNVLLAGNDLTGSFEAETERRENLRFHGRYNYDTEIAGLYGECDVIYAVYNAKGNNEKIALPNKLYEAIYCELPILVSKNTYVGELVEKWGVGISVSNIDELDNALKALEDYSEYHRIQMNCKKKKKRIINMYYSDKLGERISGLIGNKK